MAENILIIIQERRAQVVGSPVIVCGNSDYTIAFDFDSDWNLTGPKTARFVYVKGGKVQHEDKVFSGDTVNVPVLSDVSFVDVGVFAGDLCTTTPARIRCKKSILCGSGEVHEPTPDVYAQIMARFNEMAEQGAFGATEEQAQQIEANKQNIEKLTNGTTPAGDSAKLGGKGADEYVLVKGTSLSTSILDYALTLGEGEFFMRLSGSSYSGNDLPDNNYAFGSAKIYKRGAGAITVSLLGSYSATLRRITSNYYNGSQWSGWNDEVITSDLANFLPLSGGTVSANSTVPLALKSTNSADTVLMNILNKEDTQLMAIGMRLGKPVMRVMGGAWDEILYTGNYSSYAVSKDAGTATNFTLGYHSRLGVPGFEAKNNLGEVVACFGIDKTTNRIKIWNAGMTTAKFCLDTENSAATKVQASAPSDTTAVWVW